MRTLFILTLNLAVFTVCQANSAIVGIMLPKESKQLLMVTTADWNAKNGILQRYEKLNSSWQKVGEPIEIILGRNGLAWGMGLHTIPKDAKYIKKEGDGRAPAGLFSLNHGFGYEDIQIEYPYTVYKSTDHCVDDSNSQWYNQIIDSTKITKDYNSFEHMNLKNQYKYGIRVNHNSNQVAYGGSCIFMHIRNENGKATAGCTAMTEDEIIKILKWLNKDAKPVLLQLPQEEFDFAPSWLNAIDLSEF